MVHVVDVNTHNERNRACLSCVTQRAEQGVLVLCVAELSHSTHRFHHAVEIPVSRGPTSIPIIMSTSRLCVIPLCAAKGIRIPL